MSGPSAPSVWVLVDGRPGHDQQALGVAEALGWPFAIQQIRYCALARLPNRLLGASTLGLCSAARARLVAPWPDLVISAGRRTVPIARWLRRRNAAVFLAHMMWPGSTRDLDLVAVPEHDRVAGQPRLLCTIGAPSRVTRNRLSAAAAGLAPRLATLPRPHIACLIGGTRGRLRFTPQDAQVLAHRLNAFARAHGGSLLVTTSRRTGRDCEQALAQAIEAPHLLDRFGGDDPLYLGMLGCADAVVVTADSASLCSEACATGKPAFLHVARGSGPRKLAGLHKRLEQLGHLRPLGAPWPEAMPPPLDPAATVAAAIRDLLPRTGTPR